MEKNLNGGLIESESRVTGSYENLVDQLQSKLEINYGALMEVTNEQGLKFQNDLTEWIKTVDFVEGQGMTNYEVTELGRKNEKVDFGSLDINNTEEEMSGSDAIKLLALTEAKLGVVRELMEDVYPAMAWEAEDYIKLLETEKDKLMARPDEATNVWNMSNSMSLETRADKRAVMVLLIAAMLLAACSPATASAIDRNSQKQVTNTPTLVYTPTNTATLEPTSTPTKVFTPTATFTPTMTATPTEIPLDAETQAFVDKYGKEFGDYITYDEKELVYRMHLVFSGNYITDKVTLKNADGKTIGIVDLSMEMEFFDGKKIQKLVMPIMIDAGGGQCLHFATAGYYLPCARTTPEIKLEYYKKGFVPVTNGWNGGEVIEVWFPNGNNPDSMNKVNPITIGYVKANLDKYDDFLLNGNANGEMFLVNRYLYPCSDAPNVDKDMACYPELKK